MAFLSSDELKNVYPQSAAMTQDDVTKYLNRANAYAWGIIGGQPPIVDDNLKAAVAMAFEVLAKDESAQVNSVNGNITAAAPSGFYTRNEKDPLEAVRVMLKPYKDAFDQANTAQSDKGVSFL